MFALATAIATATNGLTAAPSPDRLRNELAAALVQQDAAAIHTAVAAINRHLGNKAGIPEVPDRFTAIPATGRWLTAPEAQRGFEPWFSRLEQMRWWKVGLDPTALGHALREPAAVASGNLAAARARLDGADRSLLLAKEAGDFLLWAQESAGTGGFPFPASRGVSTAPAFAAAERQLSRAGKEGRLDRMLHNGWAIDDGLDGGLQFDNGECGVALFELYEFTRDDRYLIAARKSADWALTRPLVVNWNYNSFSVYLLARAYRVTGASQYLDSATSKALLGVIPGQLKSGPHAGRWNDGHNARPSYHYILLRSLVELAVAMPANHPARPEVMAALGLGLTARNKEFNTKGAPTKDKAMEVLLAVNRSLADDPTFLRETRSAEALDALARLVSEQARRGIAPLGPREWGQFLEHVIWKSRR